MAHETDLYPLLKAYAQKNKSPYIEIDAFLGHLTSQAVQKAPENAEWTKWTTNVEVNFWAELLPLAEEKRCTLLLDTQEGQIYMAFYCLDKLRDAYENIDKLAELPFPNEESLRIDLRQEQIWDVDLHSGMGIFFGEEKKAENSEDETKAKAAMDPDQLIRILFPDGFGTAIAPAFMIPRRMAEAAMIKLRSYLFSRGNREFILHKLSPYLPGRDKYLRDMLEQLQIHPTECFVNLESSGDSASLFWSCFCSLVKNDIQKKGERLPMDVAAIQAAYFVEECNIVYQERSIKKREHIQALSELDQHLEQPPFYYTLDDIIGFTDKQGVPLLKKFSNQDLENHIKTRTSERKNNELPDWLILQGKNNERWYIKKSNYIPLCSKMLLDVRPHFRQEIIKRWAKLLREFQREAAMDSDYEFEKLLAGYTESFNAPLIALLNDPKLILVYSELERSRIPIPPPSRIVKGGQLIPLSALYALRRKELLFDAKMALPFWYSIPILVFIAAFFSRFGKKKKRSKQVDDEIRSLPDASGSEARAIQNAARKLEAALVPDGLTVEDHLTDLESRWSRLIEEDSRQFLVNDVRSLIRDGLRYAVKVYKTNQLSPESLGEIADTLISSSSALQRLGGKQALKLYMQLYMVKLLSGVKV